MTRPTFRQLGLLTPVLLLVLALSAVAQSSLDESTHLRFDRAVKSRDAQLAGLQLVVFSGIVQGTEIELRVGIANASPQPITALLAIEPEDIKLIGTDYLGKNHPIHMDAAFIRPIPEAGGLPSGRATSGGLRFILPPNNGKLLLSILGFPDLELLLDAPSFEQPDLSGLGINTNPNIKIQSQQGALGIVPWRIYSIKANSRELTFRLSFTNDARAAINWKSRLTGANFRLFDGEGTLHEPSYISDSLATGIGPMRRPWKAGEELAGTIGFKTPHAHALRSMRLVFPGYPQLLLNLRDSKFEASAQAEPALSGGQISPALESERAYRGIEELIGQINIGLNHADEGRFLSCFTPTGNIRSRQQILLRSARKAPIASSKYELPANQSFKVESDRVADVLLRFRYTIQGISKGNEFVSIVKASFGRPKGGKGWEITHFATISRQPFWELGYTGLRTTKHFLVFYPPASESAENVDKTAAQVERAYKDLEFLGFDLEDRYAAFFIPSAEHFQAFTTRDPEKFSGVASAAYEVRDGAIIATNRAMYINDYRYLVQQRVFGMQDRQKTITHELVHLALAHDTRPFTPGWLVEGAAVFHAKQVNSFTRGALRDSAITSRFSHVDLSRSPILGAGVQDTRVISLMYAYSGETFNWLVREFGRERVLDFYRAFGEPDAAELDRFVRAEVASDGDKPPEMTAVAVEMTERLVRGYFGMSLNDLTQAMRRHLKLR